MRFNLEDGFPAVTTKQLAFNAVKGELLWFLEGSDSDARLKEIMGKDRTIWTDNAEAPYWKPKAKFPGDLGRVYGVQWRSWPTPDGGHIDQISELIEMIKKNPNSRRLIVSAWNVAEINDMKLPPCHVLFQFYVANGKLSCQLYQRSCDLFLGVPFNIASYSALTMIIAKIAGYEPGEFIHTLGDAHIYHDHIEQVKEQLKRKPKEFPRLVLGKDVKDLESFRPEMVSLEDYNPQERISAKMTVAGGFDEKDRKVFLKNKKTSVNKKNKNKKRE
jgi:thymidylate synthase